MNGGRDRIGGEEGTRWKQVEAQRPLQLASSLYVSPPIIGPEAGSMFSQMSAGGSPSPGRRGSRSSLPDPASHGGPSASPRIPAPAAFPAGGAVGTKDRCMHRRNELPLDKSHKAETLPRRRGMMWSSRPFPQFHKGCPGG